MKKVFIGIIALIVFIVLGSCLGNDEKSAKSGGAASSKPQAEKTEEQVNTFGFDQAWWYSTTRERVYYLYDSDNNVLVMVSNKSKIYHVKQTDGNLTNGLYIIDPETNERARYESFKMKSGSVKMYVYDDLSRTCTTCKVGDAIKVLTKNTDFTSTYKTP